MLSKRDNELWHSLYRVPEVLKGYCDANWISNADEIYATSGYVFSLGAGAVS